MVVEPVVDIWGIRMIWLFVFVWVLWFPPIPPNVTTVLEGLVDPWLLVLVVVVVDSVLELEKVAKFYETVVVFPPPITCPWAFTLSNWVTYEVVCRLTTTETL